jgi:predicted dehydrogenase
MPDLSRRVFLAAGGAGLQAAGRKLRIGVVGGRFGTSFQWHLHPNAEVAAVCDLRADRQAALTKTYRCASAYKEYREFLKHPGLDAVAVFTPAPLHVEMAVEAMRLGKHVISAVPAGMSVEELELLLETVKKTGLRYMMAETSYYRQSVITCREFAAEGRFGTIFNAESEYHHEGLVSLMYEQGAPTWRLGFPPMLYPTHCTGMIVPVMRERLVEVQAMGWGDKHEVLRTNVYKNPFWNETAFFKTSGGHSARVSVFWHVAAGGIERGQFYGDRMSYIMERPEGSPDTIVRIEPKGVRSEADRRPPYFERLPEPLRVRSGHGDSHTFITHEFVSAVLEDRHPSVNVWEAIAYTLPGIVAHQSALRGGEVMKIRDYGAAPK